MNTDTDDTGDARTDLDTLVADVGALIGAVREGDTERLDPFSEHRSFTFTTHES